MKEISKISIVVPVYNSSKVLYELYDEVEKVFAGINLPFQLIFVDDYSHDDSWSVIRDIKNKHPNNVLAIRLAKNFGQHNAIFCGFRYCSGDLIVTMDDDLQNPPAEIIKLLDCYKETSAEVVYGISTNYKKQVVRKMASSSFKAATRWLSKSVGEGSSFRLLEKGLVKKLITHNQYFVFVDELISWYSSNFQFVIVSHEKSRIRHSRYSPVGLFNLYYGLVIGYDGTMLRTITYVGMSSSFISFLVGIYFIIKKMFFHVRLGYTGIMVGMMFSAGIILFSIGIIGEHLRKMYNLLNALPQFSVSEVIE